MKKTAVITLLLCLLLCGCSQEPTAAPLPVVTAITVSQNGSPQAAYTTDQQITSVMNYLRLLDFRGPAQVNPQYVSGPMYQFTLAYSDGRQEILWQKADRYFMGSDGIWQHIAPYSGSRLTRLLERENRTIE